MNTTHDSLCNRLRRVEGQLAKLRTVIEAKQDCTEVLPQFMAVRGALASAFAEYVKLSIAECSSKDEEKIAQLIKLLAT